jgi:Deltex C-terminal domain
LALLVKSFKRKLTFAVGYSVVRGCDNCIVWNGIHHKTGTHGGSTSYGYPDLTYFNRVKNELADKGVILES